MHGSIEGGWEGELEHGMAPGGSPRRCLLHGAGGQAEQPPVLHTPRLPPKACAHPPRPPHQGGRAPGTPAAAYTCRAAASGEVRWPGASTCCVCTRCFTMSMGQKATPVCGWRGRAGWEGGRAMVSRGWRAATGGGPPPAVLAPLQHHCLKQQTKHSQAASQAPLTGDGLRDEGGGQVGGQARLAGAHALAKLVAAAL